MDLNYILFPVPKSAYTIESLKGKLVWIPKYNPNSANSSVNKTSSAGCAITQVTYGGSLLRDKSKITVTNHKHKLKSKNIENEDNLLTFPLHKMSKQQEVQLKTVKHYAVQNQSAEKQNKNKSIPILKFNPFQTNTGSERASSTAIPDEQEALGEINERIELYSTRGVKPQMRKIALQSIPNKQPRQKISLPLRLHLLNDSKEPAADISQSDFDPDNIDEYNDTQILKFSPRAFHNYASLTLSNQTLSRKSGSQTHRQKENLLKDSKASGAYIDSVLPTKQLTHCLTDRVELKAPKLTTKALMSPQNVKKDSTKDTIVDYIPCSLLKPDIASDKILIYFHGNAEDVGGSQELLEHLKENLCVHILAMEYPGYGIYKGVPTEAAILKDSLTVYDFLTTKLKVKPSNIIVLGRSIGTGSATYLASSREIGALVLVSAFTSIRGAVKDVAGKLAQYLIKETFDNREMIKRVKCPTLLIHGQKDALIPFSHSQELHRVCGGASELILPKGMDHVEFDFDQDFTKPLISFLFRCGILDFPKPNSSRIVFPNVMFLPPEAVFKQIYQSKDQGSQSHRLILEKSIDLNALKASEIMSSKTHRTSILGF